MKKNSLLVKKIYLKSKSNTAIFNFYFKAALSHSRQNMKTRNINTEVLHNLSPLNNVSSREAF